MEYLFENIRNYFDFFLRSNITFSRKNYTEPYEDKSNIFENDLEKQTFEYLNRNYNLELIENTTIQNYLENLYYLKLFDLYINKPIKNNISILDIGSKNWYYAKSEYIFFNKYSNEIKLDGIEIDAYRMSSNFYSRYEIAKHHIKNLNNTTYIPKDFMKHNEKYDYIIWILPFITKYPHIKWGLPLKYFSPEKMLEHAYNSLNEQGEILIVNQGENEYDIQKNLNDKLKINAKYLGQVPDEYSLFKNKRYASLIKRA